MFKFRKLALLITIGLSTLGVQKTHAQNYYKDDNRTFYGGLVAGGTFSQIDGDNYAGFHKWGLTGGGIVYAEFAKHFAVSVELLYSQRGSKSNFSKLTNSQSAKVDKYQVNLDYAEVPVLLNYFDKRKSHFGVGVSYSQLINQEEIVNTTPNITDTVDLTRYPFKSNDIMGIASVNLHLIEGFFLNIRYQYSLLSIRNSYHPEFARASATRQTNNIWVVRLMYLFN